MTDKNKLSVMYLVMNILNTFVVGPSTILLLYSISSCIYKYIRREKKRRKYSISIGRLESRGPRTVYKVGMYN